MTAAIEELVNSGAMSETQRAAMLALALERAVGIIEMLHSSESYRRDRCAKSWTDWYVSAQEMEPVRVGMTLLDNKGRR